MTGRSAKSPPHWLMLEDPMFMSATGARVTRLAHANAEVFSGNSDRNGATHWMKTNWEIPKVAASAIIDARNGSATKKMIAPPAASSPPTAAHFRQPRCERAQRETLGISSSSSSVSFRGGGLHQNHR